MTLEDFADRTIDSLVANEIVKNKGRIWTQDCARSAGIADRTPNCLAS
jgi:hypothetical protein